MNSDDQIGDSGSEAPAPRTRDASVLERLRDRTDELELIISSLTIFALFSLPGWLYNRFADSYTHLSDSFAIGGVMLNTIVAGACYALGVCFIVHLMARAYWVGLIGLRTVFPRGIDWERIKSMGPITRAFYRQSLPDLDSIIESTDKLASSLFAVISMLTLGLLWLGSILVGSLVAAGTIGAQIGHTNAALGITSLVILTLFGGVPVLLYLLDGQLAARFPSLRDSPSFQKIVRPLRYISGLTYPTRLVLPVQLTLQSSMPPRVFSVAMFLAILAIIFVGNLRYAAWSSFTLSSEFTYLNGGDVGTGYRSSYYEDRSSDLDRMRAWPKISSFRQSGSHLELFLPYQPLRDNMILEQLCGERQEDYESAACLSQLWSVTLGTREVPVGDFLPAERADLAMRGLMGIVPLTDLPPGLHRLEVIWNPSPPDEAPLDDRYNTVTSRFPIPFVFAPDYELTLDAPQPSSSDTMSPSEITPGSSTDR